MSIYEKHDKQKEYKEYKVSFTWLKALSGYDWERCKIVSGGLHAHDDSVTIPSPPFLVERDRSQAIEAYKPFDDITLFTKFTDAEGTPESFRAWADVYGMLVGGEALSPIGKLHVLSENDLTLWGTMLAKSKLPPLYDTKDGSKGRWQPSESLEFWLEEHSDFSFAVMLWELAVKKDTQRLNKVVQWLSGNVGVQIRHISKAYLDKLDAYELLAEEKVDIYDREILFDNKKIRPWASALFRYPDIIRPAMFYVQTTINEKIKAYPLNIAIQIDEQGKLYKTLQPTSLLSAMWYQFFLVFTGEENIRRCAICGKWENMKGHRGTWKKHALCASNERVKRFRKPVTEYKTNELLS